MRRSYGHLLDIAQFPARAGQSQEAFNRERLAAVEQAARTRPQFLPIQHTLPAAAQTAPIVESTEALNHDVIIHGAITDGEDRNVKFYRDEENQVPLVRFGQDLNSRLSLDTIAGHSVATAGYPGILRWPEPMRLEADRSLTLEMYQETSPGAPEIVSTVFCGTRAYTAAHAEGQLSAKVRDAIQQRIKWTPAPIVNYGVAKVEFDVNGEAVAETPRTEEPLIILGFRSTFTDALVNFGFQDDTRFAVERFPIWALCAEPDNTERVFQELRSPMFLSPNQQMRFTLKNTIDGVLFATNGNLEFLYRTV